MRVVTRLFWKFHLFTAHMLKTQTELAATNCHKSPLKQLLAYLTFISLRFKPLTEKAKKTNVDMDSPAPPNLQV